MNFSVQQVRDNKRIPFYFVAFFAFIAMVDGVMVWTAVRTQTGTVTEHPYEKGLAYNKVVEAAAEQDKLGWKGEIVFEQPQKGDAAGIIKFSIADKEGNEITPDSVSAVFTRPTQAGMDFMVEVANGEASVNFPSKGLWEARVVARRGGQEYQQSKRIVVE